MRKLIKEHNDFLNHCKQNIKDKRKLDLIESTLYSLSHLHTYYDYQKKPSNLIFQSLKDNPDYPISHLIALNDYVENLANLDYLQIDEMLNYSLSKAKPFYHRETLWEMIDKDLKTNGIDSSYLKLRDYLEYEELNAEIFTFKEDKISYFSYDIDKKYYTLNDYFSDIYKQNPLKYTQSFINKLENSYEKVQEIDIEMEEMEY